MSHLRMFPSLTKLAASRPGDSAMASGAIPYAVRRAEAERYLKERAGEQPLSRVKLGLGGAAAGGGAAALIAALASRRPNTAKEALRGWGPVLRRRLGVSGAGIAGAAAGGGAGLLLQDRDRKQLEEARAQAGAPDGADRYVMQALARHRTNQARQRAAHKLMETAGPAAAVYIQSKAQERMESARTAERSRQRREDLLRSFGGDTGAESAARGLFGKKLSELDLEQLAAVKGQLG